jgi:hypothetical protein
MALIDRAPCKPCHSDNDTTRVEASRPHNSSHSEFVPNPPLCQPTNQNIAYNVKKRAPPVATPS